MVSLVLAYGEMSPYYLVEVDVHTLQLEVGRSIVAGCCQQKEVTDSEKSPLTHPHHPVHARLRLSACNTHGD